MKSHPQDPSPGQHDISLHDCPFFAHEVPPVFPVGALLPDLHVLNALQNKGAETSGGYQHFKSLHFSPSLAQLRDGPVGGDGSFTHLFQKLHFKG